MASISTDELLHLFRSGIPTAGQSCFVLRQQLPAGISSELPLATVMQFLRDATSAPGPGQALAAVEFVHRLVMEHGFELELPAAVHANGVRARLD